MQIINDISEFQTFKTNHAYQLRLMTDEEILSKAESVYNAQLLKSREHTLDSSLFGATIMNPDCSVCFQRVEECPGHYSVIQLPFPIVRSICLKDFKTLISLMKNGRLNSVCLIGIIIAIFRIPITYISQKFF